MERANCLHVAQQRHFLTERRELTFKLVEARIGHQLGSISAAYSAAFFQSSMGSGSSM